MAMACSFGYRHKSLHLFDLVPRPGLVLSSQVQDFHFELGVLKVWKNVKVILSISAVSELSFPNFG